MPKIAIVTDSTADLPDNIVEKYNIYVIPLVVSYGGQSYLDRVDNSNEGFYQYIKMASTLPKTSQPTPAQFVDTYKKCKAEGAEKIISIHISEKLSGTCSGARMAAELVKDEIEVVVIDSRTATMGLGLQVASICEFIDGSNGCSFEEILMRIHLIVDKTEIYFLLDSLDNLEKGGRIGKASYLVGSVLSIKPILVLKEGLIQVHEKIRSRKNEKAIDRLSDIIAECIDPNKNLYIVLGYNDNEKFLQHLENNLLKRLTCEEFEAFQLGSVVTTHIGLGAVGAAFYQL